MLEAIKYRHSSLEVLDQLKLPLVSEYVEVKSIEDAWNVIKKMQVRGAPAIAIVGCLALAQELRQSKFASVEELRSMVQKSMDYLVTARPTAVNITNARNSILELADQFCRQENAKVDEMQKKLISVLEATLLEDVDANRSLGEFGADAILKYQGNDKPVNVLTHCNTGSLATAGYGTALGVIRSLHKRGKLTRAYCTETRPYNQGSRLTAYELLQEGIPGTLICDSMAAALMNEGRVSAVVTGADHVALNGDTANKIGTYGLAVLAKHHNLPFYIAAPTSSISPQVISGDDIVIEERPHEEMTKIAGIPIAAPGIHCWNPAFDVTRANLITGIITEKGVFLPSEISQLIEHDSALAQNTPISARNGPQGEGRLQD